MINPMLAKASKEPFDSPNHIFEVKWDGERCVMSIENGRVARLQSRRGNNISAQFPELMTITFPVINAILDGEIVMFNGNGNVPSFNKLSTRTHLQDKQKIEMRSRMNPAFFVAFDVLSVKNTSVMELSLLQRKALLSMLVPMWGELIGQSIYTIENGMDFFRATVGQGHEGVMAKRIDGRYLEGKRSDSWLKIKPVKKSVCVVMGYKKGNGARESLGALYISEEVDGKLIERGKVGSGLSAASIKSLLSNIEETGETKVVNGELMIVVKPIVKIKVNFFEESLETGHYRFPVFRGEA
jgi:bifunctional non-homologous end joining protein LigD